MDVDPKDAAPGYACVRAANGLTAVPTWTGLGERRYNAVTGECLEEW